MNRADMRTWAAATKAQTSAWQVGLMLFCHADPAGDAWPAVATLAAETHLSRRTVQRALRELEESGEIVTTRSQGLVSVYHLTCTRDTHDTGVTSDTRVNGDTKGRHWRSKPVSPVTPRSIEVIEGGAAAASPQNGGDGATILPAAQVDRNLGGVDAAKAVLRAQRGHHPGAGDG